MRVLHFSDIHLLQGPGKVPLLDWFGKSAFGGLNLLLGRGRRFADAAAKVAALDRFRREQDIDLVIFTGDYTALGTVFELKAARQAVMPLTTAPSGYVHVPGNHDIYTLKAARDKRFLRVFGDMTTTDFPEYCVDDSPWPAVRLVGGDIAVVAVDSARPNPLPWRSSGRIPPAQLEALRRLLDDERIAHRFIFVITHYAPRLPGGEPDRRHHGLTNVDDFLHVCRSVSRGVILCGHVHHRYSVVTDGVRARTFCAGSTTLDGREGLWVFDLEGECVRATPGRWLDDGYVLEHDAAVQVE
jgi:3',5'-cyclic AMP phosphodiesterase CpdA